MDAVETRIGMPIDEFIDESSRQRFELLNGKKVLTIPTGFDHSKLMKYIYDAISRFLIEHPLGDVFPETTFILPDASDSDWVKGSRIPDVMFLTHQKIQAFAESPLNISGRPLAAIPDLAVEVVSPTDKYSDVNEKVFLYLDDGVRLVWVFDYKTKRVSAYTHDTVQHLGLNDTLSGGDVLPGFEIKLSALFA